MFLKWRFVIVFFLTAVLGTGLHFLYDVCPNPLFALVAPVNESVWEHGKLFFWPFAAAGWYLYRRGAGLGALLAAELLMPAVMLGAHYALRFGFAVEGLAVDLAIYYLTLAGGFYFAYRHRESRAFLRAAGVLAMLVCVIASCYLVFSIAAPDLPVFTPGI